MPTRKKLNQEPRSLQTFVVRRKCVCVVRK